MPIYVTTLLPTNILYELDVSRKRATACHSSLFNHSSVKNTNYECHLSCKFLRSFLLHFLLGTNTFISTWSQHLNLCLTYRLTLRNQASSYLYKTREKSIILYTFIFRFSYRIKYSDLDFPIHCGLLFIKDIAELRLNRKHITHDGQKPGFWQGTFITA